MKVTKRLQWPLIDRPIHKMTSKCPANTSQYPQHQCPLWDNGKLGKMAYQRTCIHHHRSGGMEQVAVLHSQLSFHGVSRRLWRHFSSLLTLNSNLILHALYERLCTVPLNRLPCYGTLEAIMTLLLLLLLMGHALHSAPPSLESAGQSLTPYTKWIIS